MKRLVTLFLISLVSLSLIFGAISCGKPSSPPTPSSVTPPTETPQPQPEQPTVTPEQTKQPSKSREILFYSGTPEFYDLYPVTLYTINSDGSDKTVISEKALGPHIPWLAPLWSLDGKQILYSAQEEGKKYIYWVNPDGTDKLKIAAGLHHSLSPDGKKILYHDGRWLCVINADGTGRIRLEHTMLCNLLRNILWSPDSKKIWVENPGGGSGTLFNSDGTDKIDFYRKVTISPDWTKVCLVETNAYVGALADFDIYLANADGTAEIKIASQLSGFREVVWSPDSRKVLIIAGYPFIINTDGTEKSELDSNQANTLKSQWYPEVQKVLERGKYYIYRINPDGTKTKLVEAEKEYALSPNEKKIAYSYCDRFGDYHLYVINIDGTGKTELAKFSSKILGISWAPK